MSSGTAYNSMIPRKNMGCARHRTTALSVGVKWVCSIRFSAKLAAKGDKPDSLMIDATYLKAHRMACVIKMASP